MPVERMAARAIVRPVVWGYRAICDSSHEARSLAAMGIALGPCVPTERQRRALVSPLLQDTGEGPEQTEALFAALIGERRVELLRPTASGAGRLAQCSEVFFNALADASQRLVAITDLDAFTAMLDEIDRAWMAATSWPPHYVSLQTTLQERSRVLRPRIKGL